MLNMKLTSQLTDIMEACSVEQQEDSKVVGESFPPFVVQSIIILTMATKQCLLK
jgi:hypothetical protein